MGRLPHPPSSLCWNCSAVVEGMLLSDQSALPLELKM